MTIILTESIPNAVRGLLKRWFIEPRANVFVGSVNARTREKTLNYIRRNAPTLKMLVIYDDNNCQGYTILAFGTPSRTLIRRCGLELILENPEELIEEEDDDNDYLPP
jgi:CRISPR-associated protein Cas2